MAKTMPNGNVHSGVRYSCRCAWAVGVPVRSIFRYNMILILFGEPGQTLLPFQTVVTGRDEDLFNLLLLFDSYILGAGAATSPLHGRYTGGAAL